MVALIALVVVLVTLWTVVLALALPWVIALVPTLAVVAAVGAAVVLQRIKARKAAREIEQSLKAQADAYSQQVRPDQQPEIAAMQAEFLKAVASLKSSKLARGRGGAEALSVLPWYLIIGPPGAGKSTALRNSGLQFPYLSARGGGVRGVGGTRNCEWWLTNEAVILDTAGRYTTEDNDHDEWFGFLDMLARNRPKKPVNGLLVAVSVGDLLELDEEGSAALGQRLRERVEEVMSRLKMIVPVYVLFTKCDLLAGFTEMFGDLPKAERGQIWGFTVELGGGQAPVAERFKDRFDELAHVVEERATVRLGQARRLEDRERIFQFPAAFESLRANLGELMQTLFAENVYQDTPVLRGAYFCSGTQEGRPIDKLMASMANAFGLPQALPASGERALEAKSYFLRDVFSRVIFPDQRLAVRSTQETQRQKLLQLVYAGACLVAALVVLAFPTLSFFKNRALIDEVRQRVAALQGDLQNHRGGALQKLGPLRSSLDRLVQNEEQGVPLSLRFGMYQGDELLVQTRGFYGATVRKLIVAPVMAQRLSELEAFVSEQEAHPTALSSRQHVRYFFALKLHLLLSSSREKDEPPLSPQDQLWATRELASPWAEQLGRGSDAAHEVEAHVALYLKLLAQDPALGLERRRELVARTRRVLQRLPVPALVLEQLLADPALEDYDLNLAALLGGALPELKAKNDAHVRGAFTAKGYEKVVRDRLGKAMEGADTWVLAQRPESTGSAAGAAQLRSLYFQSYIQEWSSFLDALALEVPPGNTSSLATLEDLTQGQPTPLVRFFRAVAANTRLNAADVGLGLTTFAGGAAERLGLGGLAKKTEDVAGRLAPSEGDLLTEKSVRDRFEGFVRFGAAPVTKADPGGDKSLPIDAYVEQLQFVRDGMRADIESPNDHAPLVARLQTARVRVKSLIDSQEIGWRPRLEALLWPPLDSSTRSLTGMVASDASQKWCSAVVTPFKQSLANRYPFNKNGHDAALADVASFFQPNQGTLWAFYKADLQTNVRRVGERFEFVRQLGSVAGSVYRPQVLTFLARALDVSNALFPPNASEPLVSFSIHIQPSPKIASVAFIVDGQTVDYRNGPEEWHTLKWPNPGGALGAAIKVRSTKGVTESIEQEGEWGLFRLVEQATLRSAPGARVFTLVWRIQSLDAEVVVDFRPARSETPFFGIPRAGQKPQLLQPFRSAGIYPPGAGGRGGCAG